MPYSQELYRKAERILKQRQDDAQMRAEILKSEICQEIPEINQIQSKLSMVGLELSKILFFSGDKDEKIKSLRQQSEALIEERSLMLKKNGYPANAFQPNYVCPACNDHGFVNGKLCTCHRQLLKDLMRKEISALAPLDKCTFDSFELKYYSDQPMQNSIVPRAKAEKVLDATHRYAQTFSLDSKNLMLVGGTGLGKTHLSLAIANVVINNGYSVCYGTSQNICDDLQSEQFGRGDDNTYTKKQVLECDLLILDDLGTEIDNQYSIATLYNIINSRILSKRPTIISTNFKFSALEERYENRITSRLTGEYVSMYLFGNDIRNI